MKKVKIDKADLRVNYLPANYVDSFECMFDNQSSYRFNLEEKNSRDDPLSESKGFYGKLCYYFRDLLHTAVHYSP